MIPNPMAAGFVVILQRESDDPRINAAAEALADTLNGDCINADLSAVRFTDDNGDFGQITIVDEKGQQHLAEDQKISGAQPLKNVDISLLVGDSL